jgi:ABC-type nitrate/sulfonate/bicarbonate transport system substrate-binding protein
VLDVRRGDGPPRCFDYTFSALAANDEFLRTQPDAAAAAVRAVVRTLTALKQDPNRATDAARRIFPPEETALIAELIRRDLPYYDPSIPETAIIGMNRFARDLGLIDSEVDYAQIVAAQFTPLWQSQRGAQHAKGSA